MKNKFCSAILFIMLILPVYSLQEENMDVATQPLQEVETIQEEQQNEIKTELQEDIVPAVPDKNISTPYKAPVSKKKIVLKFALAMLGVVISSLVIYIGLSLYNKIRDGISNNASEFMEEDAQLSSPHDFTDAVKSFLNNTKWD